MLINTTRRIGWVAAVIASAGLSVPAMAADKVTVEDFVVRIADAKQLTATSCDDAASALRQAGYNVTALDCGSALTEGEVARISESLGIRVTTSQPSATFGEAQVDSYFSAFARQISADGATGVDTHFEGHGTDPLQKGKGKKKGLHSPTDPV